MPQRLLSLNKQRYTFDWHHQRWWISWALILWDLIYQKCCWHWLMSFSRVIPYFSSQAQLYPFPWEEWFPYDFPWWYCLPWRYWKQHFLSLCTPLSKYGADDWQCQVWWSLLQLWTVILPISKLLQPIFIDIQCIFSKAISSHFPFWSSIGCSFQVEFWVQ